MKRTKEKEVIGTIDCVDLIDLDLYDLPCKIDTGAATSAIHCKQVRLVTENGVDYVSFKLLDPSHPNYNGKKFIVKDFKERKIVNSFGNFEYRFIIKTKVSLFGKTIVSEFSLSDREKMKYPVLLGKKLLNGRFLVDVSQKNLSYKNKENRIGK